MRAILLNLPEVAVPNQVLIRLVVHGTYDACNVTVPSFFKLGSSELRSARRLAIKPDAFDDGKEGVTVPTQERLPGRIEGVSWVAALRV